MKDLIRYFGMGVALDSAGNLHLPLLVERKAKYIYMILTAQVWSQSGDFFSDEAIKASLKYNY